ncbi:MAG: glutaredoxin 3 [Patescibacteria group bacterium]|nr:glutaredoxin 3 [Patescibacteria group bacterium]
MKNVTIYSTPTCHFCADAKKYMKDHNVAFTEHDVAHDLEQRKIMVDKSGQLGVPVIDVDGKVMVGFEESELADALGIK